MTSAELLTRFNALTGRPASDAIAPAVKYGWLSEAYRELVRSIAARFPHVLYPTVSYANTYTLATSDAQVFTFQISAVDVAPFGKVGIFPTLSSIPDNPWREGRDFISEGSQIRIPNHRSYSGTLYWRGVVDPADLDASSDPTLQPEGSRILIAYLAALNFATAYTRNLALADEMRNYLGFPWAPRAMHGAFGEWATVWRTQYRTGGALGAITGRDLALAGQHRL